MTDLFNENFDPRQVLNMLHNGFRIRGGNSFVLPASLDDLENFDFTTFFSTDSGEYAQGLLTASAFLLAFLLLWLIFLPFSCCFKNSCNNFCKLLFVYSGLALSVLGWFLSLKGNAFLQEFFENGIENAQNLSVSITTSSEIIQDILDQRPDIDQIIAGIEQDCDVFLQATNFDNLPDSSELNVLIEPQAQLESAEPTIEEIIEKITPVLEVVSNSYAGIITSILIFLAVFGGTTLISILTRKKVLNAKRGCFSHINNFVNSAGCAIFFTFGLIFTILVLVFCIIIAPVAFAGSDVCVEGLEETVLDILASSSFVTVSNAEDFCTLTSDDLAQTETLDIIGNMICHYATCSGNNIVLDAIGVSFETDGDVNVAVIQQFIEEIEDARSQLQAAANDGIVNQEDADQCDAALVPALDFMFALEGTAGDFVNLFTCDALTPVLESTLDDGVCNSLVAGLGVIFVTWTAGAVGMMVAMLSYAMLDFSAHEKVYVLDQASTIERNPSAQPAQIVQEPQFAEPVIENVKYEPQSQVAHFVEEEKPQKSSEPQKPRKKSVEPIF